MSDPADLDPADLEALLRWRLALGPGAERVSPQFALEGLRSLAAGLVATFLLYRPTLPDGDAPPTEPQPDGERPTHRIV